MYVEYYNSSAFGNLWTVRLFLWEVIWADSLDTGPSFLNSGIIYRDVPSMTPLKLQALLNLASTA